LWDEGSGGPIEIESVCLEWVLAGTSPPYERNWENSLTDKLAILGVSVLPEGCDATLRFSMTASRTSAVYGLNRRVCWSGEALEAEASMLIDGDVERTWVLADRTSPPPAEIPAWGCYDEGDSVGPSEAEELEWWHTLFSGMFGIGTELATWIEDSPDDGPVCWEGPPTEADVRVLSSLLLSTHSSPILDWLSQCLPVDQAGRDALHPLIPYLIMSNSGEMLEAITGFGFGTREEWWAWWEDQG